MPKILQQALRNRVPDLMERYGAAVAAIIAAADRLALFRMLEATSAALVAADWLIARYERMKAATRLPRLQRPDHPHRAAAVARRRRPVGAVQARPGHRPHPDRRGAGHQPGAMGRGAAPRRRVLLRARRARQCRAHGVCGRRREAVDLLLPGRRSPAFRRRQPLLRRARARRQWQVRTAEAQLVVPLDRRHPVGRRPGLCRRGAQGADPRSRADRAQGDPRRRTGLCRGMAVDRRDRCRGAGRLARGGRSCHGAGGPARRGDRQDDRQDGWPNAS